jgi:hypothetical protein
MILTTRSIRIHNHIGRELYGLCPFLRNFNLCIGDGSLNLSSRTQILLKQMNVDVFTALFKADTRVRKIDVPWGKEGE